MQTTTGHFVDSTGTNDVHVIKPYPPVNNPRPTIRIGVMAGASAFQGDGQPIREEFRLYAYLLGYRLATADIKSNVQIDLHYGGGDNGFMGDFAWGAVDAHRSAGRTTSNLCAFNILKFWQGDQHSEINTYLRSNIVIHNPHDAGFGLRKTLINATQALIGYIGGWGTKEEVFHGIVQKQHGQRSGPIVLCSLPFGSAAGGFWDYIKSIADSMHSGGTISSDEKHLVDVIEMHNHGLNGSFLHHLNDTLCSLRRSLGPAADDIDLSFSYTEFADAITSYREHKMRPKGSKQTLDRCVLSLFGGPC